MKRMSILVLFGLLALFSAGCQRVTGGNFVLPRGETIYDDLYISGGDSTLEQGSVVAGSLIVQGGEIHANGEIDGDVPVSGGDIVFGPSAIVRGEVQRSGGSVSFAPGASIRYTDRTTVSYGTRAPARGLETFILIPLLFIAIVGILLTMRSGSSMVTGAAGVQTRHTEYGLGDRVVQFASQTLALPVRCQVLSGLRRMFQFAVCFDELLGQCLLLLLDIHGAPYRANVGN